MLMLASRATPCTMLVIEAVLLRVCQGSPGMLTQVLLGWCTLAGGQVTPEPAVRVQAETFQEAPAPADATSALAPYVYQPGAGLPALLVPRDETLVYRAHIDFAIFSGEVGTVTQTCRVKDQTASVIVMEPEPAGETASIRLEAAGSYAWYELESTLETRVLPQDWPRLRYAQESKSSRGTRRREVLLGRDAEGEWKSSYRGDTRKGAPDGIRIWRAAEEREVPPGTLDSLTAVFMARTLIREEQETLSFPLIDKDRVWRLTLRRGESRRMETGAGTFDVVEVVLQPEPWPGESFAEKEEEFEGVFGIHGSIHLWVEKKSGVAVRIQGVIPVSDGLFKLGVDVILDSYSGTPSDFAPVRTAKK
jgi:hypothetical protein